MKKFFRKIFDEYKFSPEITGVCFIIEKNVVHILEVSKKLN